MSVYIKSVTQSNHLTTVQLAKSITFQNLKEVQKEYTEATKGKKITNILFDLKEVPGTDSSGVAALIDLLKYMKNHHIHGRVGLINLSENMKSLLLISKVESMFKIYLSPDEAIKDLG